jgi:Spy/CpxP family protein refolding chaperone
MADLRAQREAGRDLRQQMMQAFTQPTVDANTVEALRQKMLAQHDQASRRMMQAMLDVSRVLTPEQRTQLAQHMQQRGEMMRRHMEERRQLDAPKQ